MSSAAEMKQLQPNGTNVPVIPNKISFWQRRNILNSMSEEKHLSSNKSDCKNQFVKRYLLSCCNFKGNW